MKHRIFILLSAASLVGISHAPAQAQKTPDNLRVVPGERIGRVFLNDSNATVRRRLGKPVKTFDLGSGLSSELWRSDDSGHTIEVIYRKGRAVQIEATSPAFKTYSGYSTASSINSWLKAFKEKGRRSRYYYDKIDNEMGYLDYVGSGVAVECQGVGDVEGPGIDPITVIVHPKGKRVIPDIGYDKEYGEVDYW